MHVHEAGLGFVLVHDCQMTTVLFSILFSYEKITSSDGCLTTPTIVQNFHSVSLKLYKGRSLIKWQHAIKAGCITNK